MATQEKFSRWIDLLAALLKSRNAQTFKQLAANVPAYLEDGSVARDQPSVGVKRMFERDKDELRELGIPIESVGDLGEAESGYQLRVRDFYLPYLGVMSERGVPQMPTRITQFGYGSIESMTFEPDELQLIEDAAARVMRLGDPTLGAQTRLAMRKLAFDLPVGANDGVEVHAGEELLLPVHGRVDSKTLATIGEALIARKRITCVYHTISTDATTRRELEPYGLFFVSGHWYLAARDVEKDALRNFRVSRIAEVTVPTKTKKATADYEIPASFSLRTHAASRNAWELGNVDSMDAVVEFRGDSGAAVAARALGATDAAGPTTRRFAVRRLDSFARWLLSFAGEAIPLSPPPLVEEYRRLIQETQALYSAPEATRPEATNG